jgi:hypothetical protein
VTEVGHVIADIKRAKNHQGIGVVHIPVQDLEVLKAIVEVEMAAAQYILLKHIDQIDEISGEIADDPAHTIRINRPVLQIQMAVKQKSGLYPLLVQLLPELVTKTRVLQAMQKRKRFLKLSAWRKWKDKNAKKN